MEKLNHLFFIEPPQSRTPAEEPSISPDNYPYSWENPVTVMEALARKSTEKAQLDTVDDVIKLPFSDKHCLWLRKGDSFTALLDLDASEQVISSKYSDQENTQRKLALSEGTRLATLSLIERRIHQLGEDERTYLAANGFDPHYSLQEHIDSVLGQLKKVKSGEHYLLRPLPEANTVESVPDEQQTSGLGGTEDAHVWTLPADHALSTAARLVRKYRWVVVGGGALLSLAACTPETTPPPIIDPTAIPDATATLAPEPTKTAPEATATPEVAYTPEAPPVAPGIAVNPPEYHNLPNPIETISDETWQELENQLWLEVWKKDNKNPDTGESYEGKPYYFEGATIEEARAKYLEAINKTKANHPEYQGNKRVFADGSGMVYLYDTKTNSVMYPEKDGLIAYAQPNIYTGAKTVFVPLPEGTLPDFEKGPDGHPYLYAINDQGDAEAWFNTFNADINILAEQFREVKENKPVDKWNGDEFIKIEQSYSRWDDPELLAKVNEKLIEHKDVLDRFNSGEMIDTKVGKVKAMGPFVGRQKLPEFEGFEPTWISKMGILVMTEVITLDNPSFQGEVLVGFVATSIDDGTSYEALPVILGTHANGSSSLGRPDMSNWLSFGLYTSGVGFKEATSFNDLTNFYDQLLEQGLPVVSWGINSLSSKQGNTEVPEGWYEKFMKNYEGHIFPQIIDFAEDIDNICGTACYGPELTVVPKDFESEIASSSYEGLKARALQSPAGLVSKQLVIEGLAK